MFYLNVLVWLFAFCSFILFFNMFCGWAYKKSIKKKKSKSIIKYDYLTLKQKGFNK
jgi:hypothetical protein